MAAYCYNLSMKISVWRLRDLLVNAFEGGSNYWYYIEGTVLAEGLTDADFKKGGKMQPEDEYYHWSQLVPTTEGCALRITAPESPEMGEKLLNLEALERGLDVLMEKYPHHIASIISETDDAETGDALLQCAIYGDIIFG